MNFNLHYYGHFSIEELERMIPFERDIYTQLLCDKLEEEKRAREEALRG